MKNRIILLATFIQVLISYSSFAQPNNAAAYIGVGMNHYYRGLTPIEIYAFDINDKFNPTKPFSHLSIAPAVKIGYGSWEINHGFGLEFQRSDTRISADYEGVDSVGSIVSVSEKIKVINSKVKFEMVYFLPLNFLPEFFHRKLFVGASADIGIIRNKRKRSGAGYSDKWEYFYTNTGLTKDVKGYDLTVGFGISAGIRLSDHFTLSFQRQMLLLDADFNGYAGNKSLMNSHYNQYGITYYF
ncbi:MAG: hypothetical protein RLZ33_2971 [Bacteroidota bacterium]|jgi:hypothetical protein